MTVPGFPGIVLDPGVLGGQPVIRGIGISVRRVLAALAQADANRATVRANYPGLTDAHIQQALAFTAAMLESTLVQAAVARVCQAGGVQPGAGP